MDHRTGVEGQQTRRMSRLREVQCEMGFFEKDFWSAPIQPEPVETMLFETLNIIKKYPSTRGGDDQHNSRERKQAAENLFQRVGPLLWPDDEEIRSSWLAKGSTTAFQCLYPRDLLFSSQEDRTRLCSLFCRWVDLNSKSWDGARWDIVSDKVASSNTTRSPIDSSYEASVTISSAERSPPHCALPLSPASTTLQSSYGAFLGTRQKSKQYKDLFNTEHSVWSKSTAHSEKRKRKDANRRASTSTTIASSRIKKNGTSKRKRTESHARFPNLRRRSSTVVLHISPGKLAGMHPPGISKIYRSNSEIAGPWYFDCPPCGKRGKNLDDGSHSIACDSCGVWQHSNCKDLSREQAQAEGFVFTCRKCNEHDESGIRVTGGGNVACEASDEQNCAKDEYARISSSSPLDSGRVHLESPLSLDTSQVNTTVQLRGTTSGWHTPKRSISSAEALTSDQDTYITQANFFGSNKAVGDERTAAEEPYVNDEMADNTQCISYDYHCLPGSTMGLSGTERQDIERLLLCRAVFGIEEAEALHDPENEPTPHSPNLFPCTESAAPFVYSNITREDGAAQSLTQKERPSTAETNASLSQNIHQLIGARLSAPLPAINVKVEDESEPQASVPKFEDVVPVGSPPFIPDVKMEATDDQNPGLRDHDAGDYTAYLQAYIQLA